jgi:hypothetical protein
MRFIIPEDPEDFENLKLNGGLAKETLKKRASIVAKFKEFLQIFKLGTFEDLLKNEDYVDLDNNLAKFIQHIHVGKEGLELLPKKNTLDSYKSNLKAWILAESNNKADITNKVQFPVITVSLRFSSIILSGSGSKKQIVQFLIESIKNWFGLFSIHFSSKCKQKQ